MKKTRLRKIREGLGMTIYEVATRAGVSYEKVRQLEIGYRVEGTRYEIKEQIAHALKLNTWDVFPETKELILRMQDAKKTLFADKAQGQDK
jgi:transcriptional regulator with XRE-family HTH domain